MLRYNPPAGVRATIDGFLQAMQTREGADRRASARLYAEAGIGHDTNVNGGTFRDEVEFPFGTVKILGTSSRQVPDAYGQVAVGGQKLMRVTGRMSVFAGGDLDHRANVKERAYDLTSGGVYVASTQLGARALWRVTLGASELQVGGNRYRDTVQVSGESNLTLGPELSLMGFAQVAEFRHAQADVVRNARAATVGAMVNTSFNNLPGTPSLALRFSWTQEMNLSLRSDLSRDVPLLRVSAALTPLPALRIATGITAFRQMFGNTDVGFQTVRDDTALSADIVASYALNARWSVRGEALWSRNRSNQPLYDNDRSAVSLKLRYQL